MALKAATTLCTRRRCSMIPRLMAKSLALARPSPSPATDTAELTMGLPSTLRPQVSDKKFMDHTRAFGHGGEFKLIAS